jgi:ubiquinone/menaquinone biosynthesis C-methylase UbiE
MEKKFTNDDLKEIENQLSFPNGDKGIEVAKIMNETNIGMTQSAVSALSIKEGNSLMEIGHGNCAHLQFILDQAKKIRFTGLEISETMQQEAIRINASLMDNNSMVFQLYDGNSIPFNDESFDCIMTVNTLYFWESPIKFLNEIYRVLKPKGRVAIAFAQKEFMENLPFVNNKFNLFNNERILDLVKKSNFTDLEILDKTETVKSKNDDLVNRKYSIAILKK